MKLLLSMLSFFVVPFAFAQSLTIPIHLTNAAETPIGEMTVEDTSLGLLIVPHLSQLPPGVHGFHVHTHPNCGDHGMGAQGHLDPQNTNTHLGPYKEGHLGDLPALAVNEKGEADLPTLAPRLKIADLTGHALMIHAGGDTYADTPTLGGGGARIACGVVQ